MKVLGILVALLLAVPAQAFELAPQRIADGVYALIGPTGARTYDNHALNANFGFVVTNEGVALIDSGASRQGAQLLERAVQTVTDRPIRWVINTGSQDHRWLGNAYFEAQGAQIVALELTARTQRQFADQHLAGLERVLKDRLAGTAARITPEPISGDRTALTLGGVPIELHWFGDAHFPGDTVAWLPQQRVLFSGDLIYVDRMLGVLPWSHVESLAAGEDQTCGEQLGGA
jgi:glyoxylase-like metal-dependent hydrolase (beta-lactamase superfamily II)